jgi:hypothetical protein
MQQLYLDIIDDFIRDGEGGKPVARLVGELLREKNAEINDLRAMVADYDSELSRMRSEPCANQ